MKSFLTLLVVVSLYFTHENRSVNKDKEAAIKTGAERTGSGAGAATRAQTGAIT